MKLTKRIFDYWKIWMSVPEETNIFGSYDEGLGFYDWCYNMAGQPEPEYDESFKMEEE